MNSVQVNLFQKPSFLHHDERIPRKIQVHSMLCTNIVSNVKTKKQKNIFVHLVFFLEFNEQSLVILWVNWCKNEGFWKRFTCTNELIIYFLNFPTKCWKMKLHNSFYRVPHSYPVKKLPSTWKVWKFQNPSDLEQNVMH